MLRFSKAYQSKCLYCGDGRGNTKLKMNRKKRKGKKYYGTIQNLFKNFHTQKKTTTLFGRVNSVR